MTEPTNPCLANPDEWMADRFNEAVPQGGHWTPREVAEKLAARLQEKEPECWSAWANHHGTNYLQSQFALRHRSDRLRSFQRARVSQFQQAAEALASGAPFDPFLVPYTVDDRTGARAVLGDMTGAECRTAAQEYHSRVAENRMHAEFLDAVAPRVADDKVVREVWSSEDLTKLMASIGSIGDQS